MTGEPPDSSYIPSDPREFANRIFHTCYMGTENSSEETRRRAKLLAEAIGRYGYLEHHATVALSFILLVSVIT